MHHEVEEDGGDSDLHHGGVATDESGLECAHELADEVRGSGEEVEDAVNDFAIESPAELTEGVTTLDGALSDGSVDAEVVTGFGSPSFPFGGIHAVVIGKFFAVDEPSAEDADGKSGGCAPEDGFGESFLDEVGDRFNFFVVVDDDVGPVEPFGEVDSEEEPAAADHAEGGEDGEGDPHGGWYFVRGVGFVEVVVMGVGGPSFNGLHFGIGVEEVVGVGSVVVMVVIVVMVIVVMVVVVAGWDESPSFVAAEEGHVGHAGHIEGGKDGNEKSDSADDCADGETVPGELRAERFDEDFFF